MYKYDDLIFLLRFVVFKRILYFLQYFIRCPHRFVLLHTTLYIPAIDFMALLNQQIRGFTTPQIVTCNITDTPSVPPR